MPSAEHLAVVDAYRAYQLGVPAAALREPGVLVVPHGEGFIGYAGVYALRSGASLVISAPDAVRDAVSAVVDGRAAGEAFDARLLADALGGRVERLVGPAWIGYADAGDARGGDGGAARLLGDADAGALLSLRDACDPTEWEHGGIDPAVAPIFGMYQGGALIAAASWKEHGERIRHVGFVTHPAHRGRGYGRVVAAAITAHGVGPGAIMQWQTLLSNEPSLAVGRALGYQHRFDSLALRLRADARQQE